MSSMWILAYTLVLGQIVHALDLHDPVALPPFTRLAFGHPFSVSWTLDGSEVGDRLFLRARKVDSGEQQNWVTLTGGVKITDRKITAQIDATSSLSLPSVAYILEATDPSNTDNSYASISIAVYSDSIITSTKIKTSTPTPPQTAAGQTVNASPSSPNPQSSQSVSLSSDRKPAGTLSLPSQQSTFASNETHTESNNSPTVSSPPPTTLSPGIPSEPPKPQSIVKRPIPIGPIIGGVVGGLSIFTLVLLCMLLRSRRHNPDLNPVPMPHGETRIVPVTKRERLEHEMTGAQQQRQQLQIDLNSIRHRSVHGPITANGAPATIGRDGFVNDAQRLRFEVGMMSERILELEEALQEIEGDDRIPTHPPPDYASVADQPR
ncbi:hypothetical protein BDZ94DRAFT_866548 [Collybia nuda]|uniref:Uncharacterized protein n=1 Tax=Collybia nuda TaxID=64659 RepID=A0A9P5Y205_9AGAR|nr:hypothetical protein BDZ94DRAFT_866548 [Collybia nuda]